jgi:hypothetical protein
MSAHELDRLAWCVGPYRAATITVEGQLDLVAELLAVAPLRCFVIPSASAAHA